MNIKWPSIITLFEGDPGVEQFAKDLNGLDPELIIYQPRLHIEDAMRRCLADLPAIPPPQWFRGLEGWMQQTLSQSIFAEIAYETAIADGWPSIFQTIVIEGMLTADLAWLAQKVGAENVLCIHLGSLRVMPNGMKHVWIPVPEPDKRIEYLQKELQSVR